MKQKPELYQISLCPSAQPHMEEARVLGVVRDGEVAYLAEPVPLTPELLASTAPVGPGKVLRLAGRCQESACTHFDGSKCRLATRIVELLPAVTDSLPACLIRADCRWYLQEGRAACLRCPQVVTEFNENNEAFRRAAVGA